MSDVTLEPAVERMSAGRRLDGATAKKDLAYPEEELPMVAVPSEREEAMGSLISIKGNLIKLRTSLFNRLHLVYVRAELTDNPKSLVKWG